MCIHIMFCSDYAHTLQDQYIHKLPYEYEHEYKPTFPIHSANLK